MSEPRDGDHEVIEAARAEAERIVAEARAEAARIRSETQEWVDKVAAQVEADRAAILAEARSPAGLDGRDTPTSRDAVVDDNAWERFGRG